MLYYVNMQIKLEVSDTKGIIHFECCFQQTLSYTVNSPLMDTPNGGPLPNNGHCLMYRVHYGLCIVETPE